MLRTDNDFDSDSNQTGANSLDIQVETTVFAFSRGSDMVIGDTYSYKLYGYCEVILARGRDYNNIPNWIEMDLQIEPNGAFPDQNLCLLEKRYSLIKLLEFWIILNFLPQLLGVF